MRHLALASNKENEENLLLYLVEKTFTVDEARLSPVCLSWMDFLAKNSLLEDEACVMNLKERESARKNCAESSHSAVRST